MTVNYLFDYSGNWIAFKMGKYLYNKNGDWIGWFPYNEKIAVDTNGEYLGTIYNINRLVFDTHQSHIPYPGYPGNPGYPGYPGSPGSIWSCGSIGGVKDIDKDRLKVK